MNTASRSRARSNVRLACGVVAVLGLSTAPHARAAEADAAHDMTAACGACHGPTGNSPSSDVPSIAGQPMQFITTQLVMFREGNRKNPQMNAIASGLSNADIKSLGTFFAAQTATPSRPGLLDAAESPGRKLAEQFNCVQCHGAALRGQQHIPRIAGQHADYLKTQLRGFKGGTRYDMDGNMTSAAQALSESDIDALAGYLAGLP